MSHQAPTASIELPAESLPLRDDGEETFAHDAVRFTAFNALFAAAILFHEAKSFYLRENPFDLCMTAAALIALVRPSAMWRAALMHALILTTAIVRAPWMSNHFLFAALMGLTVLLAMARMLRSPDAGAVYRVIAPAIRIELLLLYALSAFHKLNVDFFDPQLSSGTALYLRVARHTAGLLPRAHWAQVGATYGTVIVEFLIPALLLFRPTRLVGIFVALAFQYVLGLFGFGNFSAICIAPLSLFAPPNFVAKLLYCVGRVLGSFQLPLLSAAGAWQRLVPAMTAVIVVATMIVLTIVKPWRAVPRVVWFNPDLDYHRPSPAHIFFWALWIVYGLAAIFITLALILIRRPRALPLVRPFHLTWLPVAIVPVLVLINGLCPYLGLKTESSFSMFSNLRTEGVATNHLFMGRLHWPATFQDDLVTIVASSDPRLQKFARPDMAIPYFELHSYASRKALAGEGEFSVRYTRRGRDIALEHATDDPALCAPQSLLARKLLYFRPVKFGNANIYGH